MDVKVTRFSSFFILSFILFFFLTEVMTINPFISSLIILANVIYQALFQIYISKFQNKYARFIPLYIFAFLLIFIGMNTNLNLENVKEQVLSIVVVILFYSTLFTYIQNVNLHYIRLLMNYFYSFILMMIIVGVIEYLFHVPYNDSKQSLYSMTQIHYGFIGLFYIFPIISIITTFLVKVKKADDFQIHFSKIPYLTLFLSSVFSLELFLGIFIFFIRYNLDDNLLIYLLIITCSFILSIPLYKALVNKFDKMMVYLISHVGIILGLILFILINIHLSTVSLSLLVLIIGLGLGLNLTTTVYLMNEKQNYLSLFSRKIASTVAIFILAFTLQILHYKNPIITTIDGEFSINKSIHSLSSLTNAFYIIILLSVVLIIYVVNHYKLKK